jgi:signal transduction histidine kinase
MKTQGQAAFQRIFTEIHRIQWQVEEINRHGLMLRTLAERALQSTEKDDERTEGDGTDRARSCVLLRNGSDIGPEDRHFLKATEAMEPVFMALVPGLPSILFMYVLNTRGITRGYPWKDMSVLPYQFSPTDYSFFYIAGPKQNPDRTARWTEPYLCPLAQQWMVTCASPVYVGDDFTGVMGIDINLERIIEPLEGILKATPQGYAFLVSSNGNLVVSSDEGMESLRGDDVLVHKGWRQKTARAGYGVDDVQLEEVTLSSGKAYLLHAFMECNGWSLVCVVPKGRRNVLKRILVAAETGDFLESDQGGSEKAYLPMMSFISSFSESIKQMEKLIEGTKIIGSGVLDHRIAVERKDEIGLMAMSINKMAAELEKRKEEFESVYRKINQMDRLSALGQLTAGIAHEINNPLAIISNYVQILSRNPNLHPDVLSDIQAVDEEIHRASGIIRKLLSFSGQSVAGKGVIQINDVLDNTLRLLRFQLKSQGIALVERYDEALPLTIGSPTELQQAFLNILFNAFQAMAHGGRLEVSTTHRPKKGKTGRRIIEVTISDTGRGIDGEFLDRIFDPFFTLKSPGQGTGLGLSISYGIVKEHGGGIEVRSRPGSGTQVRISLPIHGDGGGGRI